MRTWACANLLFDLTQDSLTLTRGFPFVWLGELFEFTQIDALQIAPGLPNSVGALDPGHGQPWALHLTFGQKFGFVYSLFGRNRLTNSPMSS